MTRLARLTLPSIVLASTLLGCPKPSCPDHSHDPPPDTTQYNNPTCSIQPTTWAALGSSLRCVDFAALQSAGCQPPQMYNPGNSWPWPIVQCPVSVLRTQVAVRALKGTDQCTGAPKAGFTFVIWDSESIDNPAGCHDPVCGGTPK